jgi:hypothetical protein
MTATTNNLSILKLFFVITTSPKDTSYWKEVGVKACHVIDHLLTLV